MCLTTMAAAFALGAEGVQMGTRMLSCAESPVHDNWTQAIIASAETDTVFLNQASRPALGAMRTQRTAELATLGSFPVFEHMADIQKLYFGGDLEAAIPLIGQVCGRIEQIKSARDIIDETMTGFYDVVAAMAGQYAGA